MNRADKEISCVKKPVGITGGIGSGKSSVARYCKDQFGIHYIDADQVCRNLLAPGRAAWQAFLEAFGSEFLLPDQEIDRKKLRRAIFDDHSIREQLNEIVHPLAKAEIRQIVSQTDPWRCLVEVPLLYEAGWENEFRTVIVVYATDKCCLTRLMKRDNLSIESARKAIDSQLSLTEKAALAAHVIDNSGEWEETCRQMLKLGKALWGAG